MRFLVAYDICNPRRLRRVARFMEQHGLRTQYSVFLVRTSLVDLERLLDDVSRLIDERVDCVQAWRLAENQPPDGFARGAAHPVCPQCVVYVDGQTLRIHADQSQGQHA